MKCPHCLATSLDEAHRCERCGRRLLGQPQAASEFYPIVTATAPDYAWLRDERASSPSIQGGETSIAAAATASRVPAYQKTLFESQVLQFPAPPGMERPRARRRQPASANRSRQQKGGSERRYVHQQSSFEFQLVEEQALVLPQEGIIYCDAPVADPVHRLMAGALDMSMIIIALSMFLTGFYAGGGRLVMDLNSAALCGGIFTVFWFFYSALFAIAGGDTPGMVWMGLTLVNFEGRRPDRDQRIWRMFGGMVGLFSAGLGMVWSLVDEERLTWHDHISKTFPSPIRA